MIKTPKGFTLVTRPCGHQFYVSKTIPQAKETLLNSACTFCITNEKAR